MKKNVLELEAGDIVAAMRVAQVEDLNNGWALVTFADGTTWQPRVTRTVDVQTTPTLED